MTRRRIHFLFGLAALTFGLLAACQGWRLGHADRVNTAIAEAGVAGLDDAVPEARFAHAAGLAKDGNFESAAKAYKALIQGDREDLRRAALFNLGNLHMREAGKHGGDDAAGTALPLIELAKQNYRDLLRVDPGDWDARYNLERALRLAPEPDDPASDESNVPTWERRVAPREQGFRIELP
jgi:mxaK protein